MPYPLGATLTADKNELASASAWILLYEAIADGEALRLAKNTEDVVWNDETYYAFPLEFDRIEANSEGDLPGVKLTVSNVTREVSALVRRSSGFVNSTIAIRSVKPQLSTTESREWGSYAVNGATIGTHEIVFQLGPHASFQNRFPWRVVGARCVWEYRSEECGWPAVPLLLPSGVEDVATCTKLLNGVNGCVYHGNRYIEAGHTPIHPERWGGFRVPVRR